MKEVDMMLAHVWEDHACLCIAIAALFVLALLAAVFARMLKVAVGLIALMIVIPILATIFWGDGTEYVSSISRFFEQPRREQILEGYSYFRAREEQDPVIDFRGIDEALKRTG